MEGPALRCPICKAQPAWTLTRIGDVATSWACNAHLPLVLVDLQRDHEVTQIVVRDHAKAVEWADIARDLERVVSD